ncbi:MAG TPA: DUF5666 domain-containing protein [Nitrosomonas sp.]|nr:DUF5666 domain-containing protein [Nitrosomonas sp.]
MKPWLHFLLHTVTLVITILLAVPNVFAKNNCETSLTQVNPAAGIGGTGSKVAESGGGGTGIYAGGGIGGTGHPEKGIGGTGSKLAEDGGIGGTGIIGTITGFASVCVNGVEVHYDNNTPVTVDGRLSNARELAVGQVVITRAIGSGQEVTAKHIAVVHAAVGPISHINPLTREMHVLGQVVQVTESRDLSNFKPGDWAQISGHRLANGAIIASRIEAATTATDAKINGHITHVDAKGFEVNGARIQHDAKSFPTKVSVGMEIAVAGHWNGNHLQAQHMQIEPTRQAIGQVNHLVIEGYVHAVRGKEINIANQSITLDSKAQVTGDNKEDLKLNQRVQVSGRVGPDQRIIADRVELKPESPTSLPERIDRNQTENDNRNKKSDSTNELGPRPNNKSDEDKSNQNRSGESDRGKENSKRESSDHSGKQEAASDNKSRSSESLSSGKDGRDQTDRQSQSTRSEDSERDQKNLSSDHDSRKSDSTSSSDTIAKDKLEKPIEEKPSNSSEKTDSKLRLDHPSDLSKQDREQSESKTIDADSQMVPERMPMEKSQISDQPEKSTISDRDSLDRPERPRDSDDLTERPSTDLNNIRDVMPDRIRD